MGRFLLRLVMAVFIACAVISLSDVYVLVRDGQPGQAAMLGLLCLMCLGSGAGGWLILELADARDIEQERMGPDSPRPGAEARFARFNEATKVASGELTVFEDDVQPRFKP